MSTQAYQVIARKYRPQTFAQVIGQEPTVTVLEHALRLGRIAHAYLFCGCRGTGKTTLARIFAKALNCHQPVGGIEPCNTCPSCLDITAGSALDVIEIDGASHRGIDDVRQITETISYAPSLGKYKIYLIDEVHMLTKEAFNALLKTLEEPPSHVKFFFATTEPHKIPATILSRCQRFDLRRIPTEALTAKLRHIAHDLAISCEEDVFSLVTHLADGSLRDAESLLDQVLCDVQTPITFAKVSAALGIPPRTFCFQLDAAFENQNLSYAFDLTAELFSAGKDLGHTIDQLIDHYRTLLKLKLEPHYSLPLPSFKEMYQTSLSYYTQEQCLSILDLLLHAEQSLTKTPFKRVHMEMLLLQVIRSKYKITLPSLIQRLHQLEQQFSAPKQESPPKKEPFAALLSPEAWAKKSAGPDLPSVKDSSTPNRPTQDSPPPLETTTSSQAIPSSQSFQEQLSAQEPLTTNRSTQDSLPPLETTTPSQALPSSASTLSLEDQPMVLTEPSSLQNCHYDTLVRFAAVELEGVLKGQGSLKVYLN